MNLIWFTLEMCPKKSASSTTHTSQPLKSPERTYAHTPTPCMYHPYCSCCELKISPLILFHSLCLCVCLFLPRSAWLTTDSSSVSVRWAGPDTFALPCLLSTVGVKDLPSHKAPLLDARMDCTHKRHIQNSQMAELHAHTHSFGNYPEWRSHSDLRLVSNV